MSHLPYRERAVRVGGYFTCGLLLINGFLANVEALPAVLISLAAGGAFTAGSLAVGRRYKLRQAKPSRDPPQLGLRV